MFFYFNFQPMDEQPASPTMKEGLALTTSADEDIVPHFSTRSLTLQDEKNEQALLGLDSTYFTNTQIWDNIIKEKIIPGQYVKLRNFLLTLWLPRAPGLFHTERALEYRRMASDFIIQDPEVRPKGFGSGYRVYDPYGKANLLRGGVGCIRLKEKTVNQTDVWFASASSSNVAHEGFPVAVPTDLLARYATDIHQKGFLSCNLVGKLKSVPRELSELYRMNIGVPQVYLFVEDLEYTPALPAQSSEDIRVTGAILFQSNYEGRDSIYQTFTSFSPGRPGSLEESVRWLQEDYVEGKFSGRVLTDFDERVRRFENTVFSLQSLFSATSDNLMTQLQQMGLQQSIQVVAQQVNIINSMTGGSINYQPNFNNEHPRQSGN